MHAPIRTASGDSSFPALCVEQVTCMLMAIPAALGWLGERRIHPPTVGGDGGGGGIGVGETISGIGEGKMDRLARLYGGHADKRAAEESKAKSSQAQSGQVSAAEDSKLARLAPTRDASDALPGLVCMSIVVTMLSICAGLGGMFLRARPYMLLTAALGVVGAVATACWALLHPHSAILAKVALYLFLEGGHAWAAQPGP